MAADKQNSETENAASNEAATNGENAATNENATQQSGAAVGSVKETINKVKDAAGQVAEKTQEKAAEVLGGQKNNLAAGIGAVAESVRHIGENLRQGDEENQIAAFAGQYGDSLAEQIERLSHYVEDKNFREIARDADRLARRNPTLFVGGAFVLGILAARIFKSSGRANGRRQLKISDEKTSSENTAAQAS